MGSDKAHGADEKDHAVDEGIILEGRKEDIMYENFNLGPIFINPDVFGK